MWFLKINWVRVSRLGCISCKNDPSVSRPFVISFSCSSHKDMNSSSPHPFWVLQVLRAYLIYRMLQNWQHATSSLGLKQICMLLLFLSTLSCTVCIKKKEVAKKMSCSREGHLKYPAVSQLGCWPQTKK